MKIHITIIANKKAMVFRFIASTFLLFLLGYSGFAQVPTITSFAPTSGAIGTTVIITGTNFNTTLANNLSFFGNGVYFINVLAENGGVSKSKVVLSK